MIVSLFEGIFVNKYLVIVVVAIVVNGLHACLFLLLPSCSLFCVVITVNEVIARPAAVRPSCLD